MKGWDEDDERLAFLPIEDAVTPPGGPIEHLDERYWIVHPTKGLVFYRPHKKAPPLTSPQCNRIEEITRRMLVHYPWAEVHYIASVFIPYQGD